MSPVGFKRLRAVAAVGVTVIGLAACGGADRTARLTPASSSPPPAARAASTSAAKPSAAAPSPTTARPAAAGADGVPRFDHVVVVVEENKPFDELVATPSTPYLTSLARSGAILTQSYAVTHPSEPNYLALFSGSTQGLGDDSCPHQFPGPNLAAALAAAGDTFVGYSESLPGSGYGGCSAGDYARKHAPWTDFALPASVNQPMTAFPTDFTRLPTVSFVIPNLQDDMHDGSITRGDHWLAAHLSGYETWAPAHDSLLVVTTDEDDNSDANHIATILAGAHLAPGQYPTRTGHYGLLRTLLDMYQLTPFAGAASAQPITGMWRR